MGRSPSPRARLNRLLPAALFQACFLGAVALYKPAANAVAIARYGSSSLPWLYLGAALLTAALAAWNAATPGRRMPPAAYAFIGAAACLACALALELKDVGAAWGIVRIAEPTSEPRLLAEAAELTGRILLEPALELGERKIDAVVAARVRTFTREPAGRGFRLAAGPGTGEVASHLPDDVDVRLSDEGVALLGGLCAGAACQRVAEVLLDQAEGLLDAVPAVEFEHWQAGLPRLAGDHLHEVCVESQRPPG